MKRLVMVLFTIGLLWGCQGATDSGAPLYNQAHELGWKTTHDTAALEELITCQVCHGSTFAGNGAGIPSCYSCHMGDRGFFLHPPLLQPALGWGHPANHGAIAKADITACQGCHGYPGAAGSNPAFDFPLRGLEKGCESSLGCHDNAGSSLSGSLLFTPFNNGHNPRAAHPAYDPDAPQKQDRMHWYGENVVYRGAAGAPATNYLLSHYNAGNLTTACALCHGAHLNGPAEGGVGPACSSCHVLDPVTYPSRCVSCHGPLPGPQATGIMKPAELAALIGRTGYSESSGYQTFTSELTSRMRRDPSYLPISNPQGPFYFGPSGFQLYSSIDKLTNRSSHLHHDTLPCEDRQDMEDCLGCHNDKPNNLRHHGLIFSQGLNCLNCHQLISGSGRISLVGSDDCRYCHLENFCP